MHVESCQGECSFQVPPFPSLSAAIVVACQADFQCTHLAEMRREDLAHKLGSQLRSSGLNQAGRKVIIVLEHCIQGRSAITCRHFNRPRWRAHLA